MRAFIAIELPEAVRDELAAVSRRLRDSKVRAGWVAADRMHLTLRFLGDVTDEQIHRVESTLEPRYAAFAPFDVTVRGAGAFPNLRAPSVVWVGVVPADGPLAEAQGIAEEAASAIGLHPEKRRFHPHVTLARVKDTARAGSLAQAVERERDVEAGAFTVGAVSLFSSELRPAGPVYRRLREFPLQ